MLACSWMITGSVELKFHFVRLVHGGHEMPVCKGCGQKSMETDKTDHAFFRGGIVSVVGNFKLKRGVRLCCKPSKSLKKFQLLRGRGEQFAYRTEGHSVDRAGTEGFQGFKVGGRSVTHV